MRFISLIAVVFFGWLGLWLFFLFGLFYRAWWRWTILWFRLQTDILFSFRNFFVLMVLLLRIIRLGWVLARAPTGTTEVRRWVHHHWILWHLVLLLPIVARWRHARIVILFGHYDLEHLKLILLQLTHSGHLLLIHTLWLMHHTLMIIRSPTWFLLRWCSGKDRFRH